jgi:hypothetical protein
MGLKGLFLGEVGIPSFSILFQIVYLKSSYLRQQNAHRGVGLHGFVKRPLIGDRWGS